MTERAETQADAAIQAAAARAAIAKKIAALATEPPRTRGGSS